MTVFDISAFGIAIIGALAVPRIALRRCSRCGQLARRTMKPSHRCPDRTYSVVQSVWVALVAVLSLFSLALAVGL